MMQVLQANGRCYLSVKPKKDTFAYISLKPCYMVSEIYRLKMKTPRSRHYLKTLAYIYHWVKGLYIQANQK